MTALSYAAKERNFELLKQLVEKGANVNHKSKDNETVLESACDNDIILKEADSGMVHYLVDNGAEITERTFYALCYKGQIELAKYLIAKGLPVAKGFILGAVRSGDLGFVKYLELNYNLNVNYIDSTDMETSLMMAAYGYAIKEAPYEKVNIDLMKYIISKGVDVNSISKEKSTALLNLVRYAKDDSITALCTQLLIGKGALTNIRDSSLDYSPLMFTASDKAIKTVKLLIANGADINLKNRKGQTALSLACWRYNNEEVIKCLVENGANINERDNSDETPAMNAVIFGCWENIKTLADLGADLNIKTKSGNTLLDLVNDETLKNYLISKGAKSGIKLNN